MKRLRFFRKTILISGIVFGMLFVFVFLGSEEQLHASALTVLEFDVPQSQTFLKVGEELTYNVSYSIFDIGKVTIKVIDTVTKQGELLYKTQAFMDSYSGLPFVNLHQVFYSELHPNLFSRYFSVFDTKDPNEMRYINYNFLYQKKIVEYEVGVKPKNIVEKKGNASVLAPQQDGLSLFYFSRGYVHCNQQVDVPIFINEKSFNTHFNFSNSIVAQEVDVIPYPVETKEFDGKAEFTGIFGMTGEFRGFFSNDSAAVPIVAKMKVILGSVHIELIQWNREGWIPPKAK